MTDTYFDIDNLELEPDEGVLAAALRNKDDIPILMDVVSAKVATHVSQADYLAQSLKVGSQSEEESVEAALTPASPIAEENEQTSTSLAVTREQISQAISAVLQRQLPQLVAEVMTELDKQQQ
jgi:hypothetical protein